jgi:hypothetical protein
MYVLVLEFITIIYGFIKYGMIFIIGLSLFWEAGVA